MPAPTIPTLPTAPQRSAGAADLSANADAFVAALEPWGAALDDFGDWADALSIPTPLAVDSGFAAVTTAATTALGTIGSWSATVAATGGTFTAEGVFTPTVGGIFLFGLSAVPASSSFTAGGMSVGIYNRTSGLYGGLKAGLCSPTGSAPGQRAALSCIATMQLTTGQSVDARFMSRTSADFSIAAGTAFWGRRLA